MYLEEVEKGRCLVVPLRGKEDTIQIVGVYADAIESRHKIALACGENQAATYASVTDLLYCRWRYELR